MAARTFSRAIPALSTCAAGLLCLSLVPRAQSVVTKTVAVTKPAAKAAKSSQVETKVATTGEARTFFTDVAAKAAQAEKAGATVIKGKDGWLFLPAELSSLGIGQPFWGASAARVSHVEEADARDPLPALLDFKAQLDKAGIELLLVPVPPKAAIYPEMISPVAIAQKAVRLDVYHAQFYKLLADRGFKVLDLTPQFLQRRFDNGGDLFCRQDTHWSGRACELTAQLIADQIKNRPWLKSVAKRSYGAKPQTVQIMGDLWTMLSEASLPREKLKLNVVSERTATGAKPVESWRESPIVLLGDSHNLVFHGGGDMLFENAGLADHLALRLGVPVDLVAVRGSGATPARKNLARRRDNMAGKKLVIWCFSAREFTEGQGWSKVRVIRDKAAS